MQAGRRYPLIFTHQRPKTGHNRSKTSAEAQNREPTYRQNGERGNIMENFAKDALIESIKNGDIAGAQKILQQMEKRGLEIIVQKTENN